MLDSQEIINSIDTRLAEARKEIASLESALTAMRKPSKAAAKTAAPRAGRQTTTAAPRAGRQTTTAAPRAGRQTTTAAPRAGRQTKTTAAPARAAKADASQPTSNGAAPSTSAAPADGATPDTPRRRRPRRAAPKGRPQIVPAGKLVTLLGTGDGMSTADLVTQTGGDRQQLLTLLRELEAAGEVRRSGERRSTRWHVITDEDRIAARVAELERQRRRKTPAA